jgi:hypothetical protein
VYFVPKKKFERTQFTIAQFALKNQLYVLSVLQNTIKICKYFIFPNFLNLIFNKMLPDLIWSVFILIFVNSK